MVDVQNKITHKSFNWKNNFKKSIYITMIVKIVENQIPNLSYPLGYYYKYIIHKMYSTYLFINVTSIKNYKNNN
jgi:hypothetical protein